MPWNEIQELLLEDPPEEEVVLEEPGDEPEDELEGENGIVIIPAAARVLRQRVLVEVLQAHGEDELLEDDTDDDEEDEDDDE